MMNWDRDIPMHCFNRAKGNHVIPKLFRHIRNHNVGEMTVWIHSKEMYAFPAKSQNNDKSPRKVTRLSRAFAVW